MKLVPLTVADILCVGILIGVPIISLVADKAVLAPLSHLYALKHPETYTPTIDPLAHITLYAQAAYVWDIRDQKSLYAKNASISLPLASLTKIMTSLVALEQSPKDAELTFDSNSLKEEGDSGLAVGEVWKLKKLIEFTLISSSNDGARAIATAVEALHPGTGTFVSKMNARARTLGLSSVTFNNPTGLDVDLVTAGGYGSAQDIAKLFEYLVRNHPNIFDSTNRTGVSIESNQYTHSTINTNSSIGAIPGIVGSKTGFSDLAGGNLAIIIDAGIQHPIVIVILGSTAEDRFGDMEKLSRATLASLTLEK